MTNKKFQELLSKFPDDMPIRIMHDIDDRTVTDFTDENILHTSTTASYTEAQDDDEEDIFSLGKGEQYLLLNPIIF